jgi:hypothetical protein
MNTDQIKDIAQKVLVAAGSYFVAKGYGDQSTWTNIAGGLMALGGVTWGQIHHTTK